MTKISFCFPGMAQLAGLAGCWLALCSCTAVGQLEPLRTVERLEAIPADAPKLSPASDSQPPQLLSAEFEPPLPVPGQVNTAGGEDSPFISPDGSTLYFFFTPDVSLPAERQVGDGVTGIYVAHRQDGVWGGVERVWLQDAGTLALDGCPTLAGDRLWFCTARQGLDGLHWFTAIRNAGGWQDWRQADFEPAYQVGELHFSPDGQVLYFASARPGGSGGLDLWRSTRQPGGAWGEPGNLAVVNTPGDEGWPALSPDSRELWFARDYGIWRSRWVDGEWGAPEAILSNLAGEPAVDGNGNLYFVHHYFVDGKMVESDLFVAYRK